ncbi:low molecular weight protein-tyrosine-phosphatase [Nocardioides marmorisolisilvae]|uniref:protein-tyrosine-phosphatase n=1 Tax=Nocardioides marmorisolisilvae TaxID=1542737 RepID=A0A3N0DQL8_9ACTN|nr:low molecular weight protein-tyrosine-phosphatase [Nocardioides marmorisolisilvae]RNL77756.1 low molecular weight phosphotyrosine protein phosphatase [Nocardioides marmorisolisilvae]
MRVALVCLGNICRSPTADVVLNAKLADAGLDDVVAESCGTGTWHLGEEMDARSAAVLTAAGYDPSRHRARHFDASWFDHDLILTMDRHNHSEVLAQLPTDRQDRVLMFRTFDPEVGAGAAVPDVPDPWYGGPQGFDTVLEIVERTCDGIVAHLTGPDGPDARRT